MAGADRRRSSSRARCWPGSSTAATSTSSSPRQGPRLVTGWGELHGYPIGVLANLGGAFSPAETQKAVHFIQLANATDTVAAVPAVHRRPATPRPGEAADVRHGAPLVHAVAKSTVPHLTLMIGASPAEETGGVYGRAYEPRFLFSWPVERPADGDPARASCPTTASSTPATPVPCSASAFPPCTARPWRAPSTSASSALIQTLKG